MNNEKIKNLKEQLNIVQLMILQTLDMLDLLQKAEEEEKIQKTDEKLFLKLSDIANITGLSISHIRKLSKGKDFPPLIDVSKEEASKTKYMIKKEDFDSWWKSRTHTF